MVVAEALSGLGALKTALDMTKALKDISDATIRNSAVIDLQAKILSAREAQTELLNRIVELEKQVAAFETWETEKQNYQLVTISSDVVAYARKPDTLNAMAPHFLCTNCYEERKKRILQRVDSAHVACADCKVRLRFDSEEVKAFNRPIRRGGPDGGSWMSS